MSGLHDARREDPRNGRFVVLVGVNALEYGGTETQIVELCRGLREQFSFHVVTIQGGGPLAGSLREAGIPVSCLLRAREGPGRRDVFSRFRRAATAAWHFRRLIRRVGPDVIHAQLPEISFDAAAARWPGRRPPLIISRGSLVDRIAGKRLSLSIVRWTNARADLVLANSRAVRDDVVHKEGVDPARVEIVNNGVDTERFQPGPPDPVLAASLGLPVGVFVIGVVANLHRHKGHEDLLRAVMTLRDQGRKMAVLLVGRDGNATGELRRFVSESSSPDVVFAGERSDVPELLRLMNVVVSPSHEEGSSNSILEAMASGRPVVATEVGGSPEQIVDGVSGLLVPARQPGALAAALERLLSDPQLRQRLGEAARHRAEELFSLSTLLVQMGAIYRRQATQGTAEGGSCPNLADLERPAGGIGHQAVTEANGPISRPRRRLLFVVPDDWYFLSHRSTLARAAAAAGLQVGLATRVSDGAGLLSSLPLEVIDTPIPRASESLTFVLLSTFRIWQAYRKFRPDIVNAVSLKTAIPAALAALAFPRTRVVITVAGLGFLFTGPSEEPKGWRRLPLLLLGALSRVRNLEVIVQNDDDRTVLSRYLPSKTIQLVAGTGIDTSHFAVLPEPETGFSVGFAGRMLEHKGLREFVEALRLLRAEGRPVTAILAGRSDSENPTGIPEAEIHQWEREGLLQWWGQIDDIRRLWRICHVAVLPSYREGHPRSLLEAAACGRPGVAADVPGCRDVVRDGLTGILVAARDPGSLASALARLRDDPATRRRMGLEARRRVETEFSSGKIDRETLAVLGVPTLARTES